MAKKFCTVRSGEKASLDHLLQTGCKVITLEIDSTLTFSSSLKEKIQTAVVNSDYISADLASHLDGPFFLINPYPHAGMKVALSGDGSGHVEVEASCIGFCNN